MNLRQKAVLCVTLGLLAMPGLAPGQSETHGRKWQPPPTTGHIVILVEKELNGKPMENAAVIFHATKDGKDNGNLEIKTNSQGKAIMDLLETGSHVSVQIIAHGYATAAREFDLTATDQNMVVRMQRPREQISAYAENDGKASTVLPGLQEQEHRAQSGSKPTAATVSGTLKDERGGRIPGGVIRLRTPGDIAVKASLASDAEGNFKLLNIVPGSYEMQITDPGYATKTRRLSLSAGDNLIFQETLHPSLDSSAQVPPAAATGQPK